MQRTLWHIPIVAKQLISTSNREARVETANSTVPMKIWNEQLRLYAQIDLYIVAEVLR